MEMKMISMLLHSGLTMRCLQSRAHGIGGADVASSLAVQASRQPQDKWRRCCEIGARRTPYPQYEHQALDVYSTTTSPLPSFVTPTLYPVQNMGQGGRCAHVTLSAQGSQGSEGTACIPDPTRLAQKTRHSSSPSGLIEIRRNLRIQEYPSTALRMALPPSLSLSISSGTLIT